MYDTIKYEILSLAFKTNVIEYTRFYKYSFNVEFRMDSDPCLNFIGSFNVLPTFSQLSKTHPELLI